MTEPAPVYSAKKDNGHNGSACDCDEYAAKLQRAIRRELRKLQSNGNSPMIANFLLGEIHALQLMLDGPTDQRVVVPLVRPAPTECAWPQEAACEA